MKTVGFRSTTEKKGVTDWFAMRNFSIGGSNSTSILGEAIPNLDQGAHASELEDMLGLKIRDADGIKVEVEYDNMIDVNEKNTFLLNNVKEMIKKYQLPMPLSIRANPMKEEHIECIRDGAIIALSVDGNTKD